MLNHNFAFYVSVDECVLDVFNANKSLKDIARKYPFFLLASNLQAKQIKNSERFNFIFNENSFSKKMISLLHHIKGMNISAKYWIRLDADTLVLKKNELLSMVQKNIPFNENIYAGVYSTRVSGHFLEIYDMMGLSFTKDQYIRGGCSVLTYTSMMKLLNHLDTIKPSLLDREYDYFINCICDKLGMTFMELSTFEINDEYTGESPTWHPLKIDELSRADQIIHQQKKYYEDTKPTDKG